jgi:hypothetical protein
LVQAFDYLAILLLGREARTWHHNAVARRLGQRGPSFAGAALALAAIYETARYTDGPQALPPAEREHARRALVHLAEGVPA